MSLFIDSGETAVISEGVRYLRIEGAFYALIGILFLLYGLYRALGKPEMSVVLTVMSLGTRVALAYALSALPVFGVAGDLVVCSRRLVPCGCSGYRILSYKAQKAGPVGRLFA